MKISSVFFLCTTIAVLFCNCVNSSSVNQIKNDSIISEQKVIDTLVSLKNIQFSDTILKIKDRKWFVNVIVKVPKINKAKGTILVLHGWNLPATDWCNLTELCTKALKEGYVLVMPDMGLSMYCYYLYAETRTDWVKYPTRRWVNDTLFSYFQKNYKLFLPEHKNFTLGLSTGGRGATLIALDNPHIIKGAASLSGDYDQSQPPDKGISRFYYGIQSKFPLRRFGIDNVISRIKEYKTPTYLGHSTDDRVCSVMQTIEFRDSLAKYQPKLKLKVHLVNKFQHDYVYWNSEVDHVLKFFNSL